MRSFTRLPLLFLLTLGLACPTDDWDSGDDDTAQTDDDDATGDDDDHDACGEEIPAEGGVPDDTCTSTEPYEQFDPQMEVLWQWTDPVDEPEHFQVLSIPVVIDLNLDGVPDVVFFGMANECHNCNGLLRVASGADGSELWYDTSLTEMPSGGAPAAGELVASSPGPEIVAKSVAHDVVCFSAAGEILWTTPIDTSVAKGAMALHDMDHDGEAEVIFGNVILGADGTVHGVGEYGYGKSASSQSISYAVDLDGDLELEVVVGNAAYHKDGSALWYNGEADGTTAVGDFDADPEAEIVVSGGGTLRLQEHTGEVIWSVDTLGESSNGAPPTVADFDGDGEPEIGVADKYYYQLYDTDGSLLWSHETTETSSGITGSTVFDFNGDGTAEVVYGDEEHFYIFEGSTGAILFDEPNHSSRTQIEYPVIVDVNADGSADIVLPSNTVFEDDGWDGITALTGINETGWWATRRIWNQHAYFVTNVEDDGTIPQYQVNPWEDHNSFRQARPATGWNGYPVADLVPTVDGVCTDGCPSELTLIVRVRNLGALDASAGLPVTLWDDHLNYLLASTYVPDDIPAGWTSASFEIPFDPHEVPAGAVMLRADRFSTGDEIQLECDEDNNDVVLTDLYCP